MLILINITFILFMLLIFLYNRIIYRIYYSFKFSRIIEYITCVMLFTFFVPSCVVTLYLFYWIIHSLLTHIARGAKKIELFLFSFVGTKNNNKDKNIISFIFHFHLLIKHPKALIFIFPFNNTNDEIKIKQSTIVYSSVVYRKCLILPNHQSSELGLFLSIEFKDDNRMPSLRVFRWLST